MATFVGSAKVQTHRGATASIRGNGGARRRLKKKEAGRGDCAWKNDSTGYRAFRTLHRTAVSSHALSKAFVRITIGQKTGSRGIRGKTEIRLFRQLPER